MKQLIASRQHKQALDLFDRQSTAANDSTIILALKASAKLADEQRGVRIHQSLSSSSLQNPYIRTSLVHLYMRCRRVDDAERIFSTAKQKTMFMYGAMIKGYLSNNMPEKVIGLFDEMATESNEKTVPVPIKTNVSTAGSRSIALITEIAERLPDAFLGHYEVTNSIIEQLMSNGSIDSAERLFNRTKDKTVQTYGVMLQNYIKHARFAEALDFVERIPILLNDNLLILVFKACASLCDDKAKLVGKKVFEQMPTSCLNNDIVVNSAIHMLMKFGDVQDAERLFTRAQKKTAVTYGTMMQGYSNNGQFAKTMEFCTKIPTPWNEVQYTIVYKACASLCDEAAKTMGKKLLERMPKSFLENAIVTTAIVHMLMRFNEVEHAERFAKRIKSPDRHAYSTLINGYRINEQPYTCLSLFEEMKRKGIPVDAAIAVSLIGACAQIGMRSVSEEIFQQIRHIKPDLQMQNSLVDMWGKSGRQQNAERVFRSISEPDVFSYTNMINAYGRNGMGYEAVDLYERMPTAMRNAISHVCVLNACSHAGLVEQARSIFDSIEHKTNIIFTTMVDCLSRLSLFAEAQQLISEFEKSHTPDVVLYLTLLSGARNHRQVSVARQLYDRIQSLFPDRHNDLIAASVLVANTYLSSGDEARAKEVRLVRTELSGKNVTAGVSSTRVNGEFVLFRAHDRSHPRSADILAKINQISALLKQHGHEFDSSWITRSLHDDEDSESVLCGHSEKLAIAYNLIQEPQPTFIEITKNLRVCGDCHRATKLIAKIFKCDIAVRDANRFHHFTPDGLCSCNDHF